MPKIQTNLRSEQQSRLLAQLAEGETVAGFTAGAILREITRRERGGAVKPLERKPGNPHTNKESTK